jgi:hypothetical protein
LLDQVKDILEAIKTENSPEKQEKLEIAEYLWELLEDESLIQDDLDFEVAWTSHIDALNPDQEEST